MESYATRAISRCNSFVSTCHASAMTLKQAGLLDITPSPAFSQYGLFGEHARMREQYGLNRGWIYAAVNARAAEAAAQAVQLYELAGAEMEPDERARLSRTKSWRLKSMTSSIRMKAARQEYEVVDDHSLLNLLESPNSFQNRWEFVYTFVANRHLTGSSYVFYDDEDKDRPQLYSLPSSWVTPDHSKGPYSQFKITNPKNPSAWANDNVFTRDNIGFAMLPNPSDPLAAMAPAQAQVQSIKIDDHIQTSQQRFFENGIFPSMVAVVGKNPIPGVPGAGIRPRLTGEQRRQVYSAIRKMSQGVANYGGLAVVDGLIESFQRMSATENEMGWATSEEKVKTRILSAFGVHPFILGEPVPFGGYAQAKQIKEVFYARVNTDLDALGLLMTDFLVPKFSGAEKLLVSWQPKVAIDDSLRSSQLQNAWANGIITHNEARAEMGFAPDESEQKINVGMVSAIQQLLVAAGQGMVGRDQVSAVLRGMGIEDELAAEIAGTASGSEALVEAAGALRDAVALRKAVAAIGCLPGQLAGHICEAAT